MRNDSVRKTSRKARSVPLDSLCLERSDTMRLQSELDKIVFRWKAKFDMNEMEHAGPDDSKRRFVISFYMVDQVHHILVKVCQPTSATTTKRQH